MTTDSPPIKLHTCRLCDRVRVVGKRGWMSEDDFQAAYKDDRRRIAGEVVRREPGYCDQHAKDLHANEEFESGDTVYEDHPLDDGSGQEGQS